MWDHFGTSLIAFAEVFGFKSEAISRLTSTNALSLSFSSPQEQAQLLLGTS